MAKRNQSTGAMHLEAVPHPYGTYYYLRRTYRDGRKVKHKTVANLSALPPGVIELVRAGLRGDPVAVGTQEVRCVRSLSHGAVWAVTKLMKRLDVGRLLGGQGQEWPALVTGMIAARVLAAGSKLFATRWWATTTLAEDLHLPVDEQPQTHRAPNALYAALDQLLARQDRIQKRLAQRHLTAGALVMFDLSSSYLEGRKCPLAAFGHSRDGKRGKKQITYGLLTSRDGCPVAIEVFAGNASDPMTLKPQIQRLRKAFGFTDLVVVGDRGMISQTRIADLEAAGLQWLTALRAGAIQSLHQRGVLALSIFDERNLVEVHDPEQPQRRLVACRNPLLAEERARKRCELIADTEQALDKIVARVQAGRLKKAAAIGVAVGKVIERRNVAKHFTLDIADGHFAYQRDAASIQKEAVLDGVYVVTTNVAEGRLSSDEAVASYKSLRNVEQAFRTMKTTLLELRPIFHRLEQRVRAHAFLCMLAYYVVWHMRHALQPLLSDAQGFTGLRAILQELSTIHRNTMEVRGHHFHLITEPTAQQQRVFDLLGTGTPT